MIYAAEFLISFFHLFSLTLLWRARKRNPVVLFVLFNWFFSVGTLVNLDYAIDADMEHVLLLLFSALGVAIYSLTLFNFRRYFATEYIFAKRASNGFPEFNVVSAWILFFLSILVSFLYFRYLVGYNLFLLALSGADLDFTSMRLAAYSGDSYTGAGIVNQFKNTVLPITFFLIIAIYAGARRWWSLALFVVIFLPIFLWCIMGTGQRTFLFFSIAGILYAFSVQNKRVPPLVLISLCVVFVVLFGVFSVALGRTADASLASALKEIFYRLLNANQNGAVFGFRYVYPKDVVYGAEWLQSLIGFLPGVRGSTLSSEVFNYVFGGYRGTIPVSLWASIYHNWGLVGVVPFSVLILKVIELSHYVLRFIPLSRLHLIAYSYMSFYFAIMPMTPPFQILNNGLLGIVLVFLVAGVSVKNSKISFRYS